MIVLKSAAEIEKMRKVNQMVAGVLHELKGMSKPGITTMDLEEKAKKLTKSSGAKPAFLGYRGYPHYLCVSVNEEVVHGMPSKKRELKEGDIVSIDFGLIYEEFFGDSAISFNIGNISEEARKLLGVTEEALKRAIQAVKVNNRLSDIARAVESHAEANDFSVVKQFVGHGIGRALHEDPQVPNFGTPKPDSRLREGMVLAIEPMINAGTWEVKVVENGWTAVTVDGRLSAHFEHSVAVSKNGPDVLSRYMH
jgi:methionyl aminopeptidase